MLTLPTSARRRSTLWMSASRRSMSMRRPVPGVWPRAPLICSGTVDRNPASSARAGAITSDDSRATTRDGGRVGGGSSDGSIWAEDVRGAASAARTRKNGAAKRNASARRKPNVRWAWSEFIDGPHLGFAPTVEDRSRRSCISSTLFSRGGLRGDARSSMARGPLGRLLLGSGAARGAGGAEGSAQWPSGDSSPVTRTGGGVVGIGAACGPDGAELGGACTTTVVFVVV